MEPYDTQFSGVLASDPPGDPDVRGLVISRQGASLLLVAVSIHPGGDPDVAGSDSFDRHRFRPINIRWEH